ncbi:hypothetical protein DXG01_005225, partial [Tephrocybe rancida]
NTPIHPKMPPTTNPRAPSEVSTRSRLSLSDARSPPLPPLTQPRYQHQHQPALSTASTTSSINGHTFSRSPNATPMHLPKKRRAKTPSPPNAMRVPVSVSVAGSPCVPRPTLMSMMTSSPGAAAAQNQNQNQTPARPRARITSLSMTPLRLVPFTASPKISFTSPSPRKPFVAGNGSPASKLPGTSTPKGTPPRMSNSTSSNTNTMNTTGTGSSVFSGTSSKIKAKPLLPKRTLLPKRIPFQKPGKPGVSWSQQGLLDEPLALMMGKGEVVFSAWGETDDMEMLTDVWEGEVDEEPTFLSTDVRIPGPHQRPLRPRHYKRLLERAQAAAAAQLHALQAKVHVLRSSSHPHHHNHLALTSATNASDQCVCGGRRRGYWVGYRGEDEDEDGEEEYGKRLVRSGR